MTIRRRVTRLSLAGCALLAVAVVQFYHLSNLGAALRSEGAQAISIHDGGLRLDLLAYDLLLHGEPRARQQLELQIDQLATQAHGFITSPVPHQRAIALELHRIQALLTALNNGPVRATGELPPRSRLLAEQLIIASHELFDQARLWQSTVILGQASLMRQTTISGLVWSASLLALLAVGAALLLRTIVYPVDRLRRAVGALAAGDLDQQVPVGRRDEIGMLSEDFNSMADALRTAEVARRRAAVLAAQGEALERINRELESFAALAAHELQAPLRTISSFSELALRRAGDRLDESSRGHLQRTIDAAQGMRSLIISLLSYARVGSADAAQESGICARSALDNALHHLLAVLEECGATVDIGDLPVVRCDSVQLAQVFANLIGNAVKYRDPSRPLRIRISAHAAADGWAAISVADNGPGIDPEQHEIIFGMFKRAHAGRVGGHGIGLALCRKIITQRGGELSVSSVAGQGATFTFTLPMLPEAAIPPPPPSATGH